MTEALDQHDWHYERTQIEFYTKNDASRLTIARWLDLTGRVIPMMIKLTNGMPQQQRGPRSPRRFAR